MQVSHKSLKVAHDSGSSWIPLEDLPGFLLKKYEKEIREKRTQYEEKMKKMLSEAEKAASEASSRKNARSAQTRAFLAESGLTEKEIAELNDSMVRTAAILRDPKPKRQSVDPAERSNRNPGSGTFSRRVLPQVQYDPRDYARWKERPKKWLPSKNDVLHVAIQVKNYSRVIQILEAGGSPDIVSSTGETPLVYAIKAGQLDMVVLLLKFGADVNGKNERGQTPLFLSVLSRNIGLVKVFIARGADPNAGRGVWDMVLKEDEESFGIAESLAPKGSSCPAGKLTHLSSGWVLLYGENWQQKRAEVARLQEGERRREEAASRPRFEYSGSGGSGRVCADCRGSGTCLVWSSLYRQYLSVRCRSCGGSGNAGYGGEYISNGRRYRSLMEQNLGRMMGMPGAGGGIFGN